jgi:hypothetical protein
MDFPPNVILKCLPPSLLRVSSLETLCAFESSFFVALRWNHLQHRQSREPNQTFISLYIHVRYLVLVLGTNVPGTGRERKGLLVPDVIQRVDMVL